MSGRGGLAGGGAGARGRRLWRSVGLTLVEMVVSLAIISLLMVAMASSVTLASRALPARGTAVTDASSAAGVIGELAEELRYAVHVVDRSATGVAFTVPDRDGDGSPERIAYAWSGVAGEALERSYNGGDGVAVGPGLSAFSLGYVEEAVDTAVPGPVEELAERVVASRTGLDAWNSSGVSGSNWLGQWVPASWLDLGGAGAWRPTRVAVYARGDGLLLNLVESIDLDLELRPVGADGIPLPQVVVARGLTESNLITSFGWRSAAFTLPPVLLAEQPLSLVVRRSASGSGGRVGFATSSGAWGMLTTGSGESGWQVRTQEGLLFALLGRPVVSGPEQTVRRARLAGVEVEATPAGEGSRPVRVGVAPANAPESLTGFWASDFSADPTALDANGDGVADWVLRSGLFPSSSIRSDGVWVAGSGEVLETRPSHALDRPVTAFVRFRSTSALSPAEFRVVADWDVGAGRAATIFATLERSALTAEQTLRVVAKRSVFSADDEELLVVSGLGSGFVDLRLVVEPARDTVHVAVNGGSPGRTYRYTTYTVGHSDGFVSLRSGSGAEFDAVSVRVGGESR